MEDSIKCPSCCNCYFSSKAELIEHLAPFLGDITCPVCNNKWSSIAHLLEHLSLDDCTADSAYKIEHYNIEEAQQDDSHSKELLDSKIDLHDNDYNIQNNEINDFACTTSKQTEPEHLEQGKMYVEFLNKQLLQTQEVKLVKDNGISRYVFVTDEDNTAVDSDSTIVTKQNNDGTISLTTVKEVPTESDTLITQDTEPEDNQQEIYSCNTCGVSFTSVIDHIQNYHNDQDVVVEEPMDGCDSDYASLNTLESESPVSNNAVANGSRRMITDTGDIVETPITYNYKTNAITMNNLDSGQEPLLFALQEIKEDGKTKPKGKAAAKPTILNKQLSNNDFAAVKDIKENDSKGGPYHKVILKELTTATNGKMRLFQCISCHIHVSNLDDFKNKPCKALKYQCVHCPVSYESAKSLCAHMKIHKKGAILGSNGEISYGCEICKTVFTTNKSLKLHKRMHDPIKERPIEPPVENADGGIGSTDKFLCNICQKLIPIDYETIHQNSHKNTEKFNCDICNKKFSSREYLDMHLNVHNVDKVSPVRQDNDLPYKCTFCERRFARPHEKVKHERIHTGEKPHSCEICGKSFRVSYCLTLHMRTHTGARPYACPHCGKRFKAHSVYNHHLLTHSDERNYKCPYCPKAFKTSVQLAGHKNSHTKPFSCQYCNRPFASLYAVRVHTETHSRQNNLKFSCTICGASYARAFALKDHVKQAHEDEDPKESGPVLPTSRNNASFTRDFVLKDDAKDSQNNSEDDENIMMEIINTTELIVP